MKKFAMGLVALVLLVVVGAAHGAVLTFTATGPGNKPGETLHGTATFAISNLYLIVTLSNTGTYDPKDPADILTAIFFNLANDPKLTPMSAELAAGSDAIAHPLPLGFDGDVGGEWAYRNDLTKTPDDADQGISSANLKWFSAKNLFPGPNLQGSKAPGGVQFGMTTLDDLYGNDSGGLKNQGLIQTSVVFAMAGLPENFTLDDITDVTFQYGTNLKEPDITGEALAQVPEPSTISLMAAGLVGALALVRRKTSRR